MIVKGRNIKVSCDCARNNDEWYYQPVFVLRFICKWSQRISKSTLSNRFIMHFMLTCLRNRFVLSCRFYFLLLLIFHEINFYKELREVISYKVIENSNFTITFYRRDYPKSWLFFKCKLGIVFITTFIEFYYEIFHGISIQLSYNSDLLFLVNHLYTI